ncbi:MAG: cysteine hydrolase [Magnetococcales bacterium]|nr:cysteine hydrolase [Magnetococcales bacterium]
MNNILLVIDAQKIYSDPDSVLYCPEVHSTLEKINTLVRSFEERNKGIVFVRHMHLHDGSDTGRMYDFSGQSDGTFNFVQGSDEVEFMDDLHRPITAMTITKNRYSAFVNTDLSRLLTSLKADTVTICGFMTQFCCESTARDAHDRDFHVHFIVNATGNPGSPSRTQEEIRDMTGETLQEGFALVHRLDDFLSNATELLG